MPRCLVCETLFHSQDKKRKYCSEECIIIAKHMENYVVKQKPQRLSVEQREKLQKIASRQQYASDFPPLILKDKCEVCNSTEKLRLHHISYVPVECITLCGKCHAELHAKYLKRKRVRPTYSIKENSTPSQNEKQSLDL